MKSSASIPVFLVGGGLMMILWLALLVLWSRWEEGKYRDVRSRYQPIAGVITGSEVAHEWDRMKRREVYFSRVRYRYTVQGQDYVSERVSLEGGIRDADPRDPQYELQPYPVGKRVTVFYDPGDPQAALLQVFPSEPNPAVRPFLRFLEVGSAALLLGAAGLWRSARRARLFELDPHGTSGTLPGWGRWRRTAGGLEITYRPFWPLYAVLAYLFLSFGLVFVVAFSEPGGRAVLEQVGGGIVGVLSVGIGLLVRFAGASRLWVESGQVRLTPGWLSETISLGDLAGVVLTRPNRAGSTQERVINLKKNSGTLVPVHTLRLQEETASLSQKIGSWFAHALGKPFIG